PEVGDFLQVVNAVTSLRMLDKAGPFVTNEGKRFYLKLGNYMPAILSVTDPAADARGSIVCTVEYADSVALNALGRDIDFRYDRTNNSTARFVKMQEGWKLERQ